MGGLSSVWSKTELPTTWKILIADMSALYRWLFAEGCAIRSTVRGQIDVGYLLKGVCDKEHCKRPDSHSWH